MKLFGLELKRHSQIDHGVLENKLIEERTKGWVNYVYSLESLLARSDMVDFSSNAESQFAEHANSSYKENPYAYRGIELISNACSGIALQVKDNKDNIIEDHPLLDLLQTPNEKVSGSKFINFMIKDLYIGGNAFIFKNQLGTGEIYELLLLRPNQVEVVTKDDDQVNVIGYQVNNSKEIVSPDKILQLKFYNPLHHIYGLSPLQSARNAIDTSNEIKRSNLSLLENSMRPSGILSFPNIPNLQEEEQRRIRAELNARHTGPRQTGKMLILGSDIKWDSLGLTPNEMDFANLLQNSAREIALSLGIPFSMLLEVDSMSYASFQQSRLEFYQETVIPMFKTMLHDLSVFLDVNQEGVLITFDPEKIEALSENEDAKYKRLAESNYLTINEKRNLCGFAPLPGGDALSPNSVNVTESVN